MGHTTSKVESNSKNVDGKGRRDASGNSAAVRGPPLVVAKRRSIAIRPTFEDCFGLDESQSRSTESTQGSPDMDSMYPSTARRNSVATSSASGHYHPTPLRWLRRQLSTNPSGDGGVHSHHTSSGGGGGTTTAKNKRLVQETVPVYDEDCALPPSYLEFPHLTEDDNEGDSSYTPLRTAPVPVGRPTATSTATLARTTSATTTMGAGGTTTAMGTTHTTTRKDGWNDSSEHDVDRMDELQRMYDLRTWDMYLRITEARKQKSAATATALGSSHNTMIPHSRPATDLTCAATDYDYYTPGEESMELSEQSRLDVSQSEDMIFGDLE